MARKPIFVAASLVVVGLGFALVMFSKRDQPEVQQNAGTAESSAEATGPMAKPADFTYQTTSVRIGGQDFTLDIADTADKKALGLGQRDVLPPGKGMVFAYSNPGDLCFWMKDMRFAIDIIWLDSAKQVVTIESSLRPESYPQTYCPGKPAQYVIEIPAGAASQAGLKLGDTVAISL